MNYFKGDMMKVAFINMTGGIDRGAGYIIGTGMNKKSKIHLILIIGNEQ
jgi:hypothetical protein